MGRLGEGRPSAILLSLGERGAMRRDPSNLPSSKMGSGDPSETPRFYVNDLHRGRRLHLGKRPSASCRRQSPWEQRRESSPVTSPNGLAPAMFRLPAHYLAPDLAAPLRNSGSPATETRAVDRP